MARLREDRLDEPNLSPATPIPESAQRQAAIVAGTLNPTQTNRNAGAAAGAANATDASNTLAGLQPQIGSVGTAATALAGGAGTGGGGGTGSGAGGGVGTGTNIPTTASLSTSTNDPGALQIITDGLAREGLGSLAAQVWAMSNEGYNTNAILNDPVRGIRNSQVYAQRFPAMKVLNAAGQGISESQYIAKEDADRSLIHQYLGSSASLYDNPQSLGQIISGFKSTAELQTHLQAAADAVTMANPATIQWLKDNGMSQGDLTSFWLNPDVTMQDVQRRATAGQLGGIAANTGVHLGLNSANTLANEGVTNSQGIQGFGQIGMEGQFQNQLPGDANAPVTQQDLLDATFSNNAQAQAKINLVRGQRIASFQDGGNMATDAGGVVGLKNANTP